MFKLYYFVVEDWLETSITFEEKQVDNDSRKQKSISLTGTFVEKEKER